MKNTKKILGIIAIVAIIGIGFAACNDGGGKTVTVGTQKGTLTVGKAGTVTYSVTTANIANGTYAVTVANLPSGVTVGNSGNVTISGNSGTLTLAAGTSATAATTSNLTLTLDGVTSEAFAVTVVFAIGDTGPGGGKIIYVSASGFNVTGLGTCHYLEAAPDDQGYSLVWASSGYFETYITGTGTVIGTGKANTAAILAVDKYAPAAKACADYRGGGKDDWFLPSKDELNEMYKARSHLGISSGIFWSSSQYSFYLGAWYQYFNNGSQDVVGSKYANLYVRAIRAFSLYDDSGTPTKTVTVGTQNGTLTAGTAGTFTYPVTTTLIANGTYDVTVANLPSGVTVGNSGNVTISGNSGTLTLMAGTSATAATTSNLTLTLDGVTSAAFAIAIDAHVHSYVWTVTGTTYPAQSTGTCTGCGETITRNTEIGDVGPAGGIIFYVNASGFTVTGTGSFTAYYLEAASINQGTSLAWASSGYTETNIAGTGEAIGTGKANTAAILAIDANAPAAKACADYRGGGKSDWFLPSRYELYEMYIARSHLGISSEYFWSSSQYDDSYASHQNFGSGIQYYYYYKYGNYRNGTAISVRAIRAF